MESKQQKPRFWQSGNKTVVDSRMPEVSDPKSDKSAEEITLYSQVYASRSLMKFLEHYSKYKRNAAVAMTAEKMRGHTQPIASSGPPKQATVYVIEEVQRMTQDLDKLTRLQRDVEKRLAKLMTVFQPASDETCTELEQIKSASGQ